MVKKLSEISEIPLRGGARLPYSAKNLIKEDYLAWRQRNEQLYSPPFKEVGRMFDTDYDVCKIGNARIRQACVRGGS